MEEYMEIQNIIGKEEFIELIELMKNLNQSILPKYKIIPKGNPTENALQILEAEYIVSHREQFTDNMYRAAMRYMDQTTIMVLMILRRNNNSLNEIISKLKELHERFGGSRIYLKTLKSCDRALLKELVNIEYEFYGHDYAAIIDRMGIPKSTLHKYLNNREEEGANIYRSEFENIIKETDKQQYELLNMLEHNIWMKESANSKKYMLMNLLDGDENIEEAQIVKHKLVKKLINDVEEKRIN